MGLGNVPPLLAFCPHKNACYSGCDVEPCYKCGALCPNSSWTPAEVGKKMRSMHADLKAEHERLDDLVEKYMRWKEQRTDAASSEADPD